MKFKKTVIMTLAGLGLLVAGGASVSAYENWAGHDNMTQISLDITKLVNLNNDKQNQLDKAKASQQSAQSQLDDANAKVNLLNKQLTDVKKQRADDQTSFQSQLDEKLKEINQKIAEGNQKVADKQKEVNDLNAKLSQLQQLQQGNNDQMNQAIQDASSVRQQADSAVSNATR